MDDTTIITLTTLAATLGGMLIGYIWGNEAGMHKGRALGWQEGFFYRIDQDKARRDERGRFKSRDVTGGAQ
jgi:hypothetical protein